MLLHEAAEEWLQCERKIKEVTNWINTTQNYTESNHIKRKSLRDQMVYFGKLFADAEVQKTKIILSLEKLKVYL